MIKNEDQLIACAVGDGYIQVKKVLKPNGHFRIKQSILNVVHSVKQIDYCRYKYEICKDALGGEFGLKEYTHSPPSMGGRSYQMCRFNCSNPYWKQVHSLLYINDKKTYSKDLLDKLTVRSLAIWYMDDGHLNLEYNKAGNIICAGMSIATMCSLEEVENIRNWIKDCFDVETKIACDKRFADDKKFFIRTNTKDSRKLGEILLSEIPHSMLYKIRHIINIDSTSAARPTKH